MTTTNRAIVYVDGLNLYGSALKGTDFKWLDLMSLSKTLTPAGYTLEHVKYFSAELSLVAAEDPAAPHRQRNYMKALAATGVDVRRGMFIVQTAWRSLDMATPWDNRTRPPIDPVIASQLDAKEATASRPWKVRVRLPEEKFTDVALGVEIVDDFHNSHCEMAIVITNDADIAPAITKVVAQGHQVLLFTPGDTNRHLRNAVTQHRPLRRGIFQSHQLPNIVLGPNGKSQFECPKVWKP